MNLSLRPALSDEYDFAYQVKKDAMGPHISARWGWDEALQLSIHRQRWGEKPWSIIMYRECRIGTLSLLDEGDTLRFGEFYIAAEFRGKGLGTQALRQVIIGCDKLQQNIRLEYLKWNPVGSLYRKHGFRVVSENEIHYFMHREPGRANK